MTCGHDWRLRQLVMDLENGTLEVWQCRLCGTESAHRPEGSRPLQDGTNDAIRDWLGIPESDPN